MRGTVVTEAQRNLAIERADDLATLLRDGTVSLLMGKSVPVEAIPILDRLVDLLQAAGRDTGAVLDDALECAQVLGMV